jgi:hypothetical protein
MRENTQPFAKRIRRFVGAENGQDEEFDVAEATERLEEDANPHRQAVAGIAR